MSDPVQHLSSWKQLEGWKVDEDREVRRIQLDRAPYPAVSHITHMRDEG